MPRPWRYPEGQGYWCVGRSVIPQVWHGQRYLTEPGPGRGLDHGGIQRAEGTGVSVGKSVRWDGWVTMRRRKSGRGVIRSATSWVPALIESRPWGNSSIDARSGSTRCVAVGVGVVFAERGRKRPPTTDPCGSLHNQTRCVGVSPLSRFNFTLSAVGPRSIIMFLSLWCKRGTKQTINSKSQNI